MKTSEALETVARALSAGVHPALLIAALMSEGFAQEKANTIVRWGIMFIQNSAQELKDVAQEAPTS